jgi:hypothetical protein
MKQPSGLTQIIVATAIAGVAGYVILWLVPARIGGEDYKVFAVFWAAMYLVVGALSGIQQEVTRAARPVALPAEGAPAPRVGSARVFGLLSAGAVLALVVVSAPLWVMRVFPEEGWAMVAPLAVGTASYVLVATLSGSLYGVQAWRAVAGLIAVDALLRLVSVGVTSLVTDNLVALAWAAALPFIVTLGVLWPGIRQVIVGKSQLDVRYGRLTWNVSRTLLASASSAALVSGYPLLLSLTAPEAPPALLASLFLTITLTRAPLIVVTMSLQGYLIVRFRDEARFRATFLSIMAALAASGVVLAVLGWLLGPAVFALLFPGEPVLDGGFFAVLVGSSVLVAALCVSAPAVLSRGRHMSYSLGWFAAAVVTVLALLLPLDLLTRTALSLVAGPAAGLLVNMVTLLTMSRRARMAAR